MRSRFVLIVVAVSAGIVALEQITKAWAVSSLAGEPPIEVIGSFLRFTYVENTGAAFGLGTGYTWIFTLIAIVVVMVILRTASRLGSYLWAVALGGLLGGALGNLIDRLIRDPSIGQGYVVDFIQLPLWPVFNVADMAIVGSAIAMVVLSIAGIDLRGRSARAPINE
jgi:signal peptidase II